MKKAWGLVLSSCLKEEKPQHAVPFCPFTLRSKLPFPKDALLATTTWLRTSPAQHSPAFTFTLQLLLEAHPQPQCTATAFPGHLSHQGAPFPLLCAEVGSLPYITAAGAPSPQLSPLRLSMYILPVCDTILSDMASLPSWTASSSQKEYLMKEHTSKMENLCLNRARSSLTAVWKHR